MADVIWSHSKAICCQRGMLSHVISALESHKKLHIRSTLQLLRLIQSLGTHSITAAELKQVLRLMREADDGNKVNRKKLLYSLLSK